MPALREAGDAQPEAGAREIAAILARKHDRLLLDDLYHKLIDPIVEQIKGTKGAGRDLLKSSRAHQSNSGTGGRAARAESRKGSAFWRPRRLGSGS